MSTQAGEPIVVAIGPATDAVAPTAGRLRDAAAVGTLLLVTAALHLPWITRPFGAMEINPANYFGVFARNWAQHGFWSMRGVPVGPYELNDVATGQPYLTHPPGFMWLCAAFGTDEWAIRLPATIGALLAPVLLFVLLRRRFDVLAALASALVAAVSPLLAFHATGSYEHAVLPLGLLAWLAFRRAHAADAGHRRAWLFVLALVSLLGPWMDWEYGFFAAALLPLAIGAGPRAMVRLLALPWLVSALSLALVLAWLAWATQAPALPHGLSLGHVIDSLSKARPPAPALGEVLTKSWANLIEGYSLPLLLLSLLGVPALLVRMPRLGAAAAITAVANPVLLTSHSLAHVFFWAYAAPLLGGGLAVITGWARTLPQPARGMTGALVVTTLLWATATSVQDRLQSQTPFFRDFGHALTAATAPREPGAPAAVVVHSHVPLRYGYYVRSSLVWPLPIDDPQVLEQQRQSAAPGFGIRYVLLHLQGSAIDAAPGLEPSPAMLAYLERFPHRPLPELVGEKMAVPGTDRTAHVAGAWVVDLR